MKRREGKLKKTEIKEIKQDKMIDARNLHILK